MLALQLTNIANPVIFKFNKKATAEKQFETVMQAIGPRDGTEYRPTFLLIEDDHGHKRGLWASIIETPALIDLERDMDSQAQMQVFQARAQHKAQRLIQADPALRLATVPGGQLLQS